MSRKLVYMAFAGILGLFRSYPKDEMYSSVEYPFSRSIVEMPPDLKAHDVLTMRWMQIDHGYEFPTDRTMQKTGVPYSEPEKCCFDITLQFSLNGSELDKIVY